MVNERNVHDLVNIGISNVFYGVESLHYFEGNKYYKNKRVNRSYAKNYTIETLIKENAVEKLSYL